MNKVQKVYSLFWTLYFLQSMYFMYTWKIPGGVFGLFIILMSVMFKNELGLISYSKWQFCILFTGIICFCLNYNITDVVYAINILALPICIFFLIKTPIAYRIKLVLYIRNILFYLLIPSLPLFLLHLCGITIFNCGYIENNIYKGYNYLFYFYQPVYGIRFTSYFCEPGHLGMILSFVLYANNFNLKDKKNIYLLINLLFTLSLAAYLLCFLGLIIHRINNGRLKPSSLIITFLILLCIIVIGFNVPVVKELIFDRLIFDGDTGTIAGDNRINWNAKVFLEAITNNELMYGIGPEKMNSLGISGTGFFIHVITYGLISIFFIVLYYLLILFRQKLNLISIGFFILYSISFYQRSYALWASELLLYICFVTCSNKIKDGL